MEIRSVLEGVGMGKRRQWRWAWVVASLACAACGGGGVALDEGAVGAVKTASGAPLEEAPRLEPRWLRTQGGASVDLSERMVMDSAGNTLTGFTYTGPAEASGRALPWNGRTYDRHMGIAKYRPDGTLAWVRGFAPDPVQDFAPSVRLMAMTVDPRGDVFIGGTASTGASLDGIPVRKTFLAKLDRDSGHILWARGTRPEPDTDFVFHDFEADAEGNFVALASFERFVDGALATTEMMLIKYRGSDSAPLWDHVWSQPEGVASAMDLSLDEAGNIYVGGHFDGRVDFGGEPKLEMPRDPEGGGRTGGFILALTPSGAFRWNRLVPGNAWGHTYVRSISASRSRVLVTAFGAPIFQGSQYDSGTFVMGYYSEDGAERWIQQVTRLYASSALVRAVGEEAVVVCSGDASLLGNPRWYPTDPPYYTDYQTFFVAKFWRTSGRYLGSRNVEQVTPDPRDLVATGVAVSPVDGEVSVSGHYGGETDFGTGATVTPRGSLDAFLLRLRN